MKKENVEKDVQKLKEEKKAQKAEKKRLKKEQKQLNKAATSSDSKIIAGIIIFVLLIAFGIFGFYCYKANFEVIAKFEGGKITKAEYDVYYKTFASILSQYYGYSDSMIPEEIAKKAAIDKVIVKLAKEANTQISEEDQAALNDIFNNDEYVQNFISQGMDLDRVRTLYHNDYLITQYLSDLKEKITTEDMLAYIKENSGEDADLNEYNTSHILIKTTDDSGEKLSEDKVNEAKTKAEGILAKALAGEDFATLAKENSEDTGTASEGGVYVCYDDGSTMDEYIKAVKQLEVGKVSATLVETSYGYHIIKLNEKVENGRANSNSERETYVNSFTDELEEKYAVTIDDEILNQYIISVTGSPIPEESTDTTTEEHVHEEGEEHVHEEETTE